MISCESDISGERLKRVADLWLDANLEAHSFIDQHYWLSNYEPVKRQLAQATLFVATQSKTIVGFLGITNNYIAGLFVDKRVRRQGVGRQLLDAVKAGRSELTLSVYEKNQAAYHFYNMQGFYKEAITIDEATGESVFEMKWQRSSGKGSIR